MDAIKADCRREFYPAFRTSGTRDLDDIRWVVEHVAESSSAQSTARYFKSARAEGSTHLVVGKVACYRCLPNESVPWGAQGANRYGFHIEHEGYAEWSRVKWLSDGAETIERGAFKTAYHCHLFNLPVVFRHAADLKAGKKGVTSHHECVLAFGGTHTCPGPNFPMDVYMKLVRDYYKALSPA